jgi:FAD/FMN-containing dehydrogenase
MTTATLRSDYKSWGGTLAAQHFIEWPATVGDVSRIFSSVPGLVLPFGCGRSYGDVALNPGGTLLDCKGLDRFVAFDAGNGVLVCEAGVQLASVLQNVCRLEASAAWFLPVSPGTRYVTLGGAVANDVHGKNHHGFGTIGRHVLWLDLVRSDGTLVRCSPRENEGLFAATIGGLGLTGVIVRAALQLRRVAGLSVEREDVQFSSLDEFFELAHTSENGWEYTAAWLDCAASARSRGRGIFTRARHMPGDKRDDVARGPRLSFPALPPISLINEASVKLFNAVYWRQLGKKARKEAASLASILYPLDGIANWNRVYGPKGFFQFQCALPTDAARAALDEILCEIAVSGQASMLSVLKTFGTLSSPGLLSFPRPGATLALDFPNRDHKTRALFARLEQIVSAARGALYPAKDGLMSPQTFRTSFPKADAFRPYIDPKFSSAFARRVGLIPVG